MKKKKKSSFPPTLTAVSRLTANVTVSVKTSALVTFPVKLYYIVLSHVSFLSFKSKICLLVNSASVSRLQPQTFPLRLQSCLSPDNVATCRQVDITRKSHDCTTVTTTRFCFCVLLMFIAGSTVTYTYTHK